MAEKDEVVTTAKLRLWKGIAVAAFLLGGVANWTRERIAESDAKNVEQDEKLKSLHEIAAGVDKILNSMDARVKALEDWRDGRDKEALNGKATR